MPNNCSPANVYGPLVQVLFLGLTVKNFSASASWGDQSSNLTVELVYDPCTGLRSFCNDNLLYTSSVFNGDPGWNEAPVGSAAFFKMEGFEFCGIIQSYTTKYDSSGYPIYTVTLSSPSSILAGTQVIADQYQDIVYGVPNVFNAFAFLESLDQTCPSIESGGAKFGSLAGGFGYARRTDRGTPWYLLKRAISVLTGGKYTSTYSPYGCVMYRSGVGTYGSILSNKYILDITDLPEPQNQSIYDYRLEGSVFSILDIANQVCQDAGYDYFIDLMPVQGGLSNVTNIIKFRTIIRSNQPSLTSISTFINSAPNVVSYSLGQELRNENNSALIFGAAKRQYFEQTNSTYMMPYWGKDSLDELIISNYENDQWKVQLDLRRLKPKLTDDTVGDTPDFMWVTETELRAALSSEELFKNITADPTLSSPLRDYLINVLKINKTSISLDRVNFKNSTSAVKVGGVPSADLDIHGNKAKDFKLLYGFLKTYAEENYMVKFMVSMPFVCYNTNTDTDETTFSDLPSTDGGWITGSGLLGLDQTGLPASIFKDEMGKAGAVLKFGTNYPFVIDMSGVDDTQYVQEKYNGPLFDIDYWVKCELDEAWITGNPYSGNQYAGGASTASAILKLPKRMEFRNNGFNLESLSAGFDGVAFDPSVSTAVVVSKPLAPDFFANKELNREGVEPLSGGVPVLSNTQTYGPWYSSSTVIGGVTVEQDEGLAPWEYNGIDNLDYAAFAKVDQAVTEQQVSENGSITVAGYPTVTLGSAIDGVVDLYNGRSLSIGTIDTFEYYYINVGGSSSAGAQVTNINVNVGEGGATTQYQLSSFTPVFGRFSKSNADRLVINSQNARKAQSNAFAKARLKGKI